jgi:hypothetical protein
MWLKVRNKHSFKNLRFKSRIHERTILLRFLCIILRVFRLEAYVYCVYNVNITNQFQTTIAPGGGVGGGGALASFKNVYDATLLQHTQDLFDVT